jgi:hypothetical protein
MESIWLGFNLKDTLSKISGLARLAFPNRGKPERRLGVRVTVRFSAFTTTGSAIKFVFDDSAAQKRKKSVGGEKERVKGRKKRGSYTQRSQATLQDLLWRTFLKRQKGVCCPHLSFDLSRNKAKKEGTKT